MPNSSEPRGGLRRWSMILELALSHRNYWTSSASIGISPMSCSRACAGVPPKLALNGLIDADGGDERTTRDSPDHHGTTTGDSTGTDGFHDLGQPAGGQGDLDGLAFASGNLWGPAFHRCDPSIFHGSSGGFDPLPTSGPGTPFPEQGSCRVKRPLSPGLRQRRVTPPRLNRTPPPAHCARGPGTGSGSDCAPHNQSTGLARRR